MTTSTPAVEKTVNQHPISRNSALIGSILTERFFNKELIAEGLGITEEKNEEFWTIQRFIVTDRVYAYLATIIGLDLAINRDYELSDLDTSRLLYEATKYKGAEFYLNTVRPWYLNYGKVFQEAAKEKRRIREFLDTHGLYILAFPQEGGRPLFVQVDPVNGKVSQVENREDATMFPVGNPAFLEKNSKYIAEIAEQFGYLKAILNAKELKIFAGSNSSK